MEPVESNLNTFDSFHLEPMNSNSSQRSSTFSFIIGAASAMVIALIVLFIFKLNDPLFKYWEDQPALELDPIKNEKWIPAMKAYEQSNWEGAEEELYALKSDTAAYFLGVTAFEQGWYELSASRLYTLTPSSVWYGEATFRRALLLIKLGREEEAVESLVAFKKISGFKGKEIGELLQE